MKLNIFKKKAGKDKFIIFYPVLKDHVRAVILTETYYKIFCAAQMRTPKYFQK